MSVPTSYPKRIQEHIEEAQANYDRYETMLKKPADISWGLVFLFYSALHLVQAYARLNTPNDVPGDHEDRNNYVAYYMPEGIAVKYTKLYSISRQVRYGPCRFELNKVLSIQADIFAPIRKHLREQGVAWQSHDSSRREQ